MFIPRKLIFVPIVPVQSMMYAHIGVHHGRGSYSFVCTLHYLIIVITQIIERMPKIKSILPMIHGAVGFQLTHFTFDDCTNLNLNILLSESNRKYDSLAMV